MPHMFQRIYRQICHGLVLHRCQMSIVQQGRYCVNVAHVPADFSMSGPNHATSDISGNKSIITLCTQTIRSQTCFRDLEGELRLLLLALARMHLSLISCPAPADLRLESCSHLLPGSEIDKDIASLCWILAGVYPSLSSCPQSSGAAPVTSFTQLSVDCL